MTNDKTHVCQCPCGGVRYPVRGDPLFRILCHCSICRRFNDATYADVLVYRATAVEQPEPGSVSFDTYRPPPNVQRGRCVRCRRAAIELFAAPLLPRLVMMPAQVFPTPETLPAPIGHMFYEGRVADVDDGLPKHTGYMGSQLAFGRHLLRTMLGRGGPR